jgi:hypothetical protein
MTTTHTPQAEFNVIFDVIEAALTMSQTKAQAIQLLMNFAAGKDAVLGTADDRMTPETLDYFKHMIHDGSVDRLVERMFKHNCLKSIFGCRCCRSIPKTLSNCHLTQVTK